MSDLTPEQRKTMQNMIEDAAKEQQQHLAWVGNLYRKRLQELQQMEERRQAWLKSQETNENTNELA